MRDRDFVTRGEIEALKQVTDAKILAARIQAEAKAELKLLIAIVVVAMTLLFSDIQLP